ncbi:YggS family pyridoxal phosphate-dependent enzyme [Thermodesulforhabdus norvegica]|uniref:Pyridoxal phosphate homeostasis protein n=1 Tax=Thermodesulforhabdus norvegica TaxID=39841 RepID=A0A1I4SC07_9BACT|nr:YggS family pyridoxal phosphate-dependent enzyme [Thermodesulforhabdus norvegica]SFM62012.1 hypothetical protein SAMN05660836_00880 [Thermodesulforhabdus norvegica]
MGGIKENLRLVRERVARACERSNRSPDEIVIIGVTKTFDASVVKEAVEAGITHIGENYVQEARSKKEILGNIPVTWHMIGHLQSNKAKQAVQIFDWIHTLDRLSLAEKLNRLVSQQKDKPLPVLLQVKVGQEDTKSGIAPDELFRLYDEVSQMEGLQIRGLMTIPPYFENPEDVRPYFRQLADLLKRLKDRSDRPELLTELSMGMSHDFEVAIEEGATMIRVGTAIFGERPSCRR